MALNGHALIFGGGANGLMGAAARGAFANGGEIIGIAPSFFNVDGILFENCTDFIYTETMGERKKLLVESSDAFIVAPGGPGTFDEFFETFTLKQLELHNKPLVLFNVNGYYDSLLSLLENAVNGEFMPKSNLELIFVSDNPEEIIKYIENY